MLYKPTSPEGVVEEIPEVNDFKEILRYCSRTYKNKDAFYIKRNNSYEGISYIQFERDINALGTSLISFGLKDEKIAVIGENRYEWCVSYMAATCGTGVVVPLDKELPESELMNLLTRSKAAAIIYSKKTAPMIEKICTLCPHLKVLISMDEPASNENIYSLAELIATGNQLISEGNKSFVNAAVDSTVMNILVFTSGTTELAKGVMLSQKNIICDIYSVTQMIYIGSKDSILSILPLHHTYECTCGFLVQLFSGSTISFCESMKSIAKNLQEVKPTILMMVPLILENMYKKILKTVEKSIPKKYILKTATVVSNALIKTVKVDVTKKLFREIHNNIGGRIRLIISGAAAIDPVVTRWFETIGICIRQGYGMTECSPIITVNAMDQYRHDSIGTALPGIAVEIYHPDSSGIGEIRVKGGIVMLGYFENARATSKILKDGWLYTGDIGYKDSEGFFYITGRKKNVIVTKNGKNIFPEEVESYLDKSPFILESMVYGEEDGEGDIQVAAELVLNHEVIDEKLKDASISEEDLYKIIQREVKHVNRQMPLYKRIIHFTIRDKEFEKTTTHKIKRYNNN